MTARDDLLRHACAVAAGNGSGADPRLLRQGVDPATARRAAVLMLFGVLDDVPAVSPLDLVAADLDVLLLERATTLNSHPGQVAFPGGSIDPGDATTADAALREAQEETGLDPAGVEVLGVMPELAIPHSNFLVKPVLAWWAAPSPIRVVDPAESAQVFRIPVRDLLAPDNRVTVTVAGRERLPGTPGFLVNGVVVWGFTAMILDHLFAQLGWAVPWDARRGHVLSLE